MNLSNELAETDDLFPGWRPLRTVPLETLQAVWKLSESPGYARRHALRVWFVRRELDAREAEAVATLIHEESRS